MSTTTIFTHPRNSRRRVKLTLTVKFAGSSPAECVLLHLDFRRLPAMSGNPRSSFKTCILKALYLDIEKPD
ncbi:hypothetical protein [Leisingera sp. ANG-M6]|uniref:hypothetical protein n=1 Tax=Leisingera sp. ANG-M6 TaxID=1577900 RepID=UPI001269B7F2|nr:hypothetical protein [Leisingera sp. ANG-M6]